MNTKLTSIWNNFSAAHNYPALQKNISVDVAIIGGGITGLTVSRLLANQGVQNAVLESRKAGGGTTSHSTGNLYYTIDSNLSSLKEKYDIETIRTVAGSRAAALEQMINWIQNYEIECDFKTVPMYLYSSTEENVQTIRAELETGKKARLKMSKADPDEISFPVEEALKMIDQAQINPARYVQGLAASLKPAISQIYEQTHVSSVEEKNGNYILSTSGGTVTAGNVVHATHTPKGIKFVQTLLGPYREYGIACTVNSGVHSGGIFWGYYKGGKKISSRIYNSSGKQYLIVVGEPHKTGHAENNEQRMKALEEFAHLYFDVEQVEFRWGGQHYRPADSLPYIGPRQKNSGEYIATGYSTDGLIYGTLAGSIIADHIIGRENKWAEIYSATRKRPAKAARKFLQENVDVAKHYLKEIVHFPEGKLENIKTGEGKILTHEGKKMAVSRNDDGELEIVSAICTHMGCTVNWNNAEKSWDCPCHGSRFETDGNVLEGPAFEPLQK